MATLGFRGVGAGSVQRVDLSAHALLPGLINSHTHNAMTLMRGLADDLPLMTWLQEHIWPAEAKAVGPEFVRDDVEIAIAEMLRGGTTCCNENYFFPDVQAATYLKYGFRAVVGLPFIEFPSAWATSPAMRATAPSICSASPATRTAVSVAWYFAIER